MAEPRIVSIDLTHLVREALATERIGRFPADPGSDGRESTEFETTREPGTAP